LIAEYQVQDKVKLMGKRTPEELKAITSSAYIGINLVENVGLNQYYSLANKFFDYINAGVPQITMRFPEYSLINTEYEVAVLIDEINIQTITEAFEKISAPETHERLKQNCMRAREIYNWQNEEMELIAFYKKMEH